MKEGSELDRLAEAELLLEAERGLARSNVCGPTGWKRCPLPGTNKKFLQNTIKNAVNSNKLKEQKLEIKLGKVKSDLRRESDSKLQQRNTTKGVDKKYRRKHEPTTKVKMDSQKKEQQTYKSINK